MWNPGRMSRTNSMAHSPSRTTSIHSPARSIASSRGSYADSYGGVSPVINDTNLWHQANAMKPLTIGIHRDHPRRDSISTQDSHSTLAHDEDIHDISELALKTPTVLPKSYEQPQVSTIEISSDTASDDGSDAPMATRTTFEPTAASGPLEKQLLALLSRVSLIEQAQPTIMASDYKDLQDRVEALEAEKATWAKRHEALYALRDEDLQNLIKVRDMLAAERKAHEAMRKLRDDDIKNLVEIRDQLAHATWTAPNRPAAAESTSASSSPARERSATSRMSISFAGAAGAVVNSARQSRSLEGHDLWQSARTAAMEQKVLELERANAELKAQVATSPSTVAATPMPSISAAPITAIKTTHHDGIETFLEDSMKQREKMAARMQLLRCEKEMLQRDCAKLEDRNGELEAVVERLQRKMVR